MLHFCVTASDCVQIIEAADGLGIKDQSIVGLLKGATQVLSELDPSIISEGLLSLTTMISRPLTQVSQLHTRSKL